MREESILTEERTQAPSIRRDKKPASALPDWFQAAQAKAWEAFQSLPFPLRTEAAWRFTSQNHLKQIEAHLQNVSTDLESEAPLSNREHLQSRSVGNQKVDGKMIFANDQLLAYQPAAVLEKQGVVFKPLETAMVEHKELFQKHFMAQENILGSKKFAAFHQARVKTGTFLYVPKDVKVELPLEVFHWLTGKDQSVFPHTLLIAEEGSEVTLIDYFQSAQVEDNGFACAVNDLIVGEGAKVTYLCAQNWGEKVLSFQLNTTTVQRDASALSLNLNLGSAYARLESLSRLMDQGARSDMLAATIAHASQEYDQRTLQDHIAPNTTSDLLYKNALNDTSRTIFAGLIRVEPKAQNTDAYQKVRNLLLSEEAEANSMPGLEILADDVRCTHGATSGAVEEEEMFYLLSRGIDPLTAKQLIVHGFLHEVLERLPHGGGVIERLSEMLAAKFTRMRIAN